MNTSASSSKRKRNSAKQASEPEGGTEGRKRGRPRVENATQSNAERRRTQIRMAQRAYRQRKEGAMDELRDLVSELTGTIDSMFKAFEDCRKRLTSGALLDSQAKDLEQLSFTYKQWVSRIHGSEHSESSEGETLMADIPTDADLTFEPSIPSPTNVPGWIDQGAVTRAARLTVRSPLGYSLVAEDSVGVAGLASTSMVNLNSQALARNNQSNVGMDEFWSNNPIHQFLRGLDPPRSFSHLEPTFARRVHRACMETLYQFVLDGDRHGQVFQRVFKLSSLPSDPNKLAPGIRMILDRGPNETLDGAARSSIHIGGAGTHYPRHDPIGHFEAREPGIYAGVVTVETLKLLQSTLDTNISVDVAGFEGQWFDPYDLEGYLDEKGIHIDAGATYVEAELSSLSSSSNGASTRSLTPNERQALPKQVINGLSPQPQSLQIQNPDFEPTVWEDMLASDPLTLGSVGFSDMTGSWMNFLPPSHPAKSRLSPAPQGTSSNSMSQQNSIDTTFEEISPVATSQIFATDSSKKSAVIDVTKFTEDLVFAGLCLGSTPGFRREDVDRLLTSAVVEVY